MKLIQLGDKPYFSHQKKGIEWMINREEDSLDIMNYKISGGILADEMGLGKTFEVLGLIANRIVNATLILTPLAVLQTWIKTAEATGIFNIYIVDGKAGQYNWERYFYAGRAAPCIYISNMEKLVRNPSLGFTNKMQLMDRLIVDEAHKMRNCMGSTYDAICAINADHRWAVTATPIVNSLQDAASLLHFVGGGDAVLEKRLRWYDEYDNILPLIVLRRTVAELRDTLDFLPAKPVEEFVKLSFETRAEEEFYNAIQGNIKDRLADKYMYDTLSGTEKLLMLLRLRQISVHPQVYISARRNAAGSYYDRDDWDGPSTKFKAIKKIISNELSQKNDYLIFCSFEHEILMLKKYLKSKNLASNIETYYGGMTADQRECALERAQKAAANSSSSTVFICQINSGGVGLNLQYLNRVIFLSPWWTAATMEQAIGRVIRIGQKRQVTITYLQLEAEFDGDDTYVSIDNLIYGAVDRKRKISEKFFETVAA